MGSGTEMPWTERNDRDGLAMIQFCKERAEDLGCNGCDPQRWAPDSTDRKDWPCSNPILPAIRANANGIREIRYRQCEKYREWAKARGKKAEPKTYGDGGRFGRRRAA